ncbi:MAG: hypothetical protein ACOYCD_05515 [Kiritimatiellia bacterium]|jgi:hypothetical protein
MSQPNHTHRRRLANIILLSSLLVLTLYCILRMPYDRRRLYECVPSSVVMVSAHHNLAARYEELATNTFLQPFLQAAGLDISKLTPANAKRLRRYAPYIAGHETLLAWAPAMHGNGQPGLIAISWMGRSGMLARWRLELCRPRQLQRLPAYAGHSIWSSAQPINSDGLRVVFTIYEGILLALIAPDQNGIREVIQTAERLRKPANILADPNFMALPAKSADRFWLQHPAMTAAINDIQPDFFNAVIRAPDLLPADADGLPPDDIKSIGTLLGDRPVMTAVLPTQSACHIAACHPALKYLHYLLPPQANPFPSSLGLAVFTGDDGGGIGRGLWRIKIPALIGVLSIQNPEEGQVLVKRTLDRLNAAYKLALITDAGTKLPAQPAVNIFTIEPTTDNFLTRLAPKDRPAYAILDRQLVFSSNADALIRRLTAAARDVPPGTHQLTTPAATPCAGMLQVHLPGAIPVIQSGLTAWVLHMRASGHTELPNSIQTLRQWLDILRDMETASISLVPSRPELLIEIRSGKARN